VQNDNISCYQSAWKDWIHEFLCASIECCASLADQEIQTLLADAIIFGGYDVLWSRLTSCEVEFFMSQSWSNT
jgi:hypothetical protein